MEKPENLQSIAEEITRMIKVDLAMRDRSEANKGVIEDEDDNMVDIANTLRMKEIVDSIGWPCTSKVGAEAASDAALIVRHADHDVEFQKKCLELMKELPEGEVDSGDLAYLEDRVRVNSGRLQLYGTQFYISPKTGLYIPRPIENTKELDERRARIGFEPMEEYSRNWDEMNEQIKKGIRKF